LTEVAEWTGIGNSHLVDETVEIRVELTEAHSETGRCLVLNEIQRRIRGTIQVHVELRVGVGYADVQA
jgi:hypothetical protein